MKRYEIVVETAIEELERNDDMACVRLENGNYCKAHYHR
jgi:hypothetical protein